MPLGFCGSCGAVLETGVAFCGDCGAAAPSATATSASAKVTSAVNQAPTVCPACGGPDCVGEFCGTTGQRIAPGARTTPAPAAVPVAVASAGPKRSFGPGKIVFVACALLLLAGFGYVAVQSRLLRGVTQHLPPALPKAMAGTITEFPVDTATNNAAKPTNVSMQPLGQAAAPPKFSPKALPPGLTPKMLPGMGSSITSAQYQSSPQDPPVNVHVVDVNGDPAQTTQQLASTIESNKEQPQLACRFGALALTWFSTTRTSF